MSDRLDRLLPDFGEYSLDAILASYTAEMNAAGKGPSAAGAPDAAADVPGEQAAPEDAAAAPPPAGESIADRSRRIVMSALGETLRQYRRDNEHQPQETESPAAGFDAPAPSETEPQAAPAPEPEHAPAVEPQDGPTPEPEPGPAPIAEAAPEDGRESGFPPEEAPKPEPPAKPKRPRFSMGEDGIITLIYDTDGPPPWAEPDEETDGDTEPSEPEEPDADDDAGAGEAAEDGEAPPAEADGTVSAKKASRPRQKTGRGRSKRARLTFSEAVLAPAVRLVALLLARRQQQSAEASAWPEPEDLPETPELTPKNASKYYAAQAKRLRTRCRISLFLTVILAWIALGLPMAGMLGKSTPLQAGVSLLLTLAVMLAALDVFTAGLRQIFDLAPGAEALAALASLLSCVDGALVLLGFGTALPFCAVGAAALTAALWGSRLNCLALMRTFRTVSAAHNPTCLISDEGRDGSPRRLYRTERESLDGLVRRSERQDVCRTVYAAAAPILLGAAFILSAAAAIGGEAGWFLHIFSALVSVAASFAAFLGYPIAYAVTARRLRASGVAVAGCAGCADIAGARELVVTDSDLFPPGTMRFSAINILEGISQQKVIIAAASMVFVSGSGTIPLFEELAERRSCHVPEPREYTIHESGGISGVVSGEHVDVGPARFMNLQGIRLPQNMPAKNTVCVAIEGELVGVFVIEYTPFTSVQEALVTLMRGRVDPVFAVRDCNITPRMVHDLFKLPSANFNFPAFRDRDRIRPDRDRPIDAVITRGGMLPFVEAAEAGRKLYSTSRIAAVLSLIGSVIGMVILFLLCRTGAFDTASVGNVLSFMVLWALPAVILPYGRSR